MTVRQTIKRVSIFDEIAADIVRAGKGSRRLPADTHSAGEEIHFLEQHDYRRSLRRSLARPEVRQIVAEAKRTVWPRLNDESVKLVSPAEFTRRWSGLGVQFQLAKFGGVEGLELLGFYVRKMGGSRLPLICVNTAHHRAAIGAAFSHEMGHHLIGRLFDSRKEHAQLFAHTAYREHLDEPEELAADILVSLGVFPEATARRTFLKPEKRTSSESATGGFSDSVSAAVLKYMEGGFGLSFGGSLPSAMKLQYLAAVIHFSKLRLALLTEYDI